MSDDNSSGSPSAPPPTSATSAPPKWDDPCAAYKKLVALREEMISGQAVAEFEYQGNNTIRRTKYSVGNLAAMDKDIREAYDACCASLNMPNKQRRFAIEAGSRPPRYFGGYDPRRGY